jgi:hypothetical protein
MYEVKVTVGIAFVKVPAELGNTSRIVDKNMKNI